MSALLETKATRALPLIVDLDGTLLQTDTLHEGFVSGVFSKPFRTLSALFKLMDGRASLKAAIAALNSTDFEVMPRNPALLEYLEAEHAAGREIYLVTAADQTIADQIVASHPFFVAAFGSKGGKNLKGKSKADFLCTQFKDGFVYAGDSSADLEVWKVADAAIAVRPRKSVHEKLTALNTEIEADFPREGSRSTRQAWRKALRLHQWSKNILLFVPLFLAHVYFDQELVVKVAIGFLLTGVVASGTYILNDLSDLASDRKHRTKKNRPFASGGLGILNGFLVAIGLIAIGITVSFILKPQFGLMLVIYLCTTLTYSWWLKKVALVDVFTLGLLYTIRLFLGISLIDVSVSPWLIAFAFLFFYSLSLAKRHVELVRSDLPPHQLIAGRGYRSGDWPITLSLGIATSLGALVVIVLYLTEEAFPSGAYSRPEFLWAAPMLMTLWVQRIWLLAGRGELDDDPVSFAVRDPSSIILGLFLAGFFIAAVVA